LAAANEWGGEKEKERERWKMDEKKERLKGRKTIKER